jgi:hypothetical protein
MTDQSKGSDQLAQSHGDASRAPEILQLQDRIDATRYMPGLPLGGRVLGACYLLALLLFWFVVGIPSSELEFAIFYLLGAVGTGVVIATMVAYGFAVKRRRALQAQVERLLTADKGEEEERDEIGGRENFTR